MAIIKGKVRAGRIIKAISRIGYKPSLAILDIADNSVSHKSTRVSIVLDSTQIKHESGKRSQTILNQVQIFDNGTGMNQDQLINALDLGSNMEGYSKDTLSAFGLGLKSASSSLGKRLEIFTTDGNKILKGILDHDNFVNDDYSYEILTITKSDEAKELIEWLGKSKTGTLVKISKIHTQNLPSIKSINEDLLLRSGITYYPMLSKGLELHLNGQPIKAVDPLFRDEIKNTNSWNEKNWNGLTCEWISQTRKIQISKDGSIGGQLTIVQLPHPPSVAHETKVSKNEVRDRYIIGANNYGIYVYRNNRLISWADSLDGLVTRDQDLFSFRGVLEIGSDADDILNIDVAKSRIELSDIAREQLTPIINEAKKKSINAWNAAKERLREFAGEDPRSEVNSALDDIEKDLEKDDVIEAEALPPEEQKAARKAHDVATKQSTTDGDEKNQVQQGNRVIYVDSLDNNQLWQRAHDPKYGLIVRVNKSHRFIRHIINSLSGNSAALQITDILLFALARGEYKTIYNPATEIPELTEKILNDFRETTGDNLSQIVKHLVEGSKIKFLDDEN